LPVTTNDVPSSSLIFGILLMDALRSSEASVLTRATRPNVQENSILHSHHRGNLKSYQHIFYTALEPIISTTALHKCGLYGYVIATRLQGNDVLIIAQYNLSLRLFTGIHSVTSSFTLRRSLFAFSHRFPEMFVSVSWVYCRLQY
jgi:hypothetical protein